MLGASAGINSCISVGASRGTSDPNILGNCVVGGTLVEGSDVSGSHCGTSVAGADTRTLWSEASGPSIVATSVSVLAEGAIGSTVAEANGEGVEEPAATRAAGGTGDKDAFWCLKVDSGPCVSVAADTVDVPTAVSTLVLACMGSMATNDASNPAACSLESLKN